MTPLAHLRSLFQPVLAGLLPDPSTVGGYLDMIRPATNADHGDYQANFAMKLKPVLGKSPPEIAKLVIERMPANDAIASATVAGPGFINIKLKDEWLAKAIADTTADQRLGVPVVASPKTFVIDLSGPNVAKPLHIGHIRSTIIGDALVRILRFCGHTVVGDNHLGDWGTQFGILLYGYKHHRNDDAFQTDPVRELSRLYIHVRRLAEVTGEEDEGTGDIMEACRLETAKLHAGDAENVALWKRFMPACLEMLKPIYERLDVHIDHALGESFYNPMLAGVVADLLAKQVAVESNGAVVVPNAKGVVPKPGETKEEPPALIRKRDGAFTYTTTDLATIKYRIETWKPDAMLYVVDARQALHFKTLFANARRSGYANVAMEHIQFGSILGRDKKPFQTRKGDTVGLSGLLDEAVAVGLAKYEASYADRKAHGHDIPDLTDETKKEIAEAVGVGAVKYADLSQNRTSDYVFDTDKMTATDGNTASYMQYAYARCRSIFRRGEIDSTELAAGVSIATPQERALALQLLRFGEALDAASGEYMPHHLTAYLWDVAKAYNGFFESCPVLKAEPAVRDSRLVLVDRTARVIQQTLQLLGIRTVERM